MNYASSVVRRVIPTALFTLLLCVGIAVHSNPTSAQALEEEQFRVLRHELLSIQRSPAAETQSDAQPSLPSELREMAPKATWSFVAFGRQFILMLESNAELVANLPQPQREHLARTGVQLYKGSIAGVPKTWVRITEHHGKLSGAIWDGNELYLIDDGAEIAQALAQPSASGPIMYRLTDTRGAPVTCGVSAQSQPIHDYRALVQELNQLVDPAAAATRRLDVAIVADVEFVQANVSNPDAAALARMNVVDGIFSEQAGVKLNVTRVQKLSSNASVSSTSPSTLLNQFSSLSNSASFVNPGLAHLFTGRDLDGSTIGIAYLSSLCSKRFGVGVSQTRGTGTAGALTVAHELGHNFGAPHDNQSGSACASTPNGFIMNPSLNGSTTFSACSLSQMRPVVDRSACVVPITTTASADVRLILPATTLSVAANTAFTLRAEARNSGTAAANNGRLTLSVPSGMTVQSATSTLGTCSNSGTSINCAIGTLAAGAAANVSVNLRSAAGAFTSNLSVAADNDSNTSNNGGSVRINVGSTTGGTILIFSRFESGPSGYNYVDDAFRGTAQPSYASGAHAPGRGFGGGGGMLVRLGGVDARAVNGMSAGWRFGFSLPLTRSVTVSLRYQVVQGANYESDELSQALVAIDGRLVGEGGLDYLAQVNGNGDGDGGTPTTAGWNEVRLTVGPLAPGAHTITIGGYNNKKDAADEITEVVFDDVVVQY